MQDPLTSCWGEALGTEVLRASIAKQGVLPPFRAHLAQCLGYDAAPSGPDPWRTGVFQRHALAR